MFYSISSRFPKQACNGNMLHILELSRPRVERTCPATTRTIIKPPTLNRILDEWLYSNPLLGSI
jgi:hypothetical protein